MSVPARLDEYLIAPVFARAQVLARPCPVPVAAGVYGWWFRELPADIDTSGCRTRDGLTLLYTGISPRRPPQNGRAPSRQTLRTRITYHYRGNAEGSTLRKTLGCLLGAELGIDLRRYGSGTRRHFGTGEAILNRWLEANAFVSWIACDTPWVVEEELIQYLDVPLNIDTNSHNAFYPKLKEVRAAAVRHANELPVLPNPGRSRVV
ncbi:hypothetical protein OG921_04635 [Aldersonia sp. NBC_00410]|uniref:GIY-YIG nuclease family protein n=1 Tax=Aldersonia sp. NBC_00410 TaxID=2975954 RepID=UPI002257D311|nr:hypothetical protein [Aldersonia sp. NBC_00410]MCX5042459.1 hypothetical protein [Aldersonia sp. NBC_00410]